MKKLLTTLVVFLTAFAFVFAHGQTEAATASEEIVINVWGGLPAENGPNEICEAYNASHPGVKVVYTYYTNDDAGNTKLDTALLSKADIDIFISHDHARFVTRANNGMCIALDDYLKKANLDVEKDFGNSCAHIDGKWFGLAVTDSRDFIWINKDIFDAAGIKIPTYWTVDEYKAAAKALTETTKDGKRYGTMIHYSWANSWMRPAFVALGDKVVSDKYIYAVDNPYFAKALQLRYDMEVTDGSMVPTSLAKTSGLSVQNMFLSEQVAMFHGGSWIIRYAKDLTTYPHDFKIAFAPLPHWTESDAGYFNSTGCLNEYLAITPTCKNQDAAFDFLKYWATEGYYPLCKGGKVPAWVGADQDKVIANLMGDNASEIFDVESVKNVLFGHQDYFIAPTAKGSAEVINALNIEADKCFGGQQTVAQTIEAMKAAAAKIVSENK